MKTPYVYYDDEGDILFINLALSESDRDSLEIARTLELDGMTGVVMQLGERHPHCH